MICSLRGVGLFILELSCILALSVKAAVQHPVSDFRLYEPVAGIAHTAGSEEHVSHHLFRRS